MSGGAFLSLCNDDEVNPDEVKRGKAWSGFTQSCTEDKCQGSLRKR